MTDRQGVARWAGRHGLKGARAGWRAARIAFIDAARHCAKKFATTARHRAMAEARWLGKDWMLARAISLEALDIGVSALTAAFAQSSAGVSKAIFGFVDSRGGPGSG